MIRQLRRTCALVVSVVAFGIQALCDSPAWAEHFRVLDPASGQLAAVADLNGATLVMHLGATNRTYSRRIDLDGQDFLCFERTDKNRFVRWPANLPGPLFFGVGNQDTIAWSDKEFRVQPFGPPPGTAVFKSRMVVPNEPLPPLKVAIQNSNTQDVIVGFYDIRKHPLSPREHTLPPQGSQNYLLERDAGATIETVFTVVTPAGDTVERVDRVPIPPQRIWDLVIWESKVTYRVVGRPELDKKTRRSLGVLYLPAGLDMPDTIDVFAEAQKADNPGAAAAYPSP